MYCIVLYCIVLYCIVLYCIVLYCIVLYCIALYCIVLYCIVLYCIVLYCIVLYCIVFYCIVLYCIVLYCIVLYCIVLYCIVLYCIVLYCIVLYCIPVGSNLLDGISADANERLMRSLTAEWRKCRPAWTLNSSVSSPHMHSCGAHTGAIRRRAIAILSDESSSLLPTEELGRAVKVSRMRSCRRDESGTPGLRLCSRQHLFLLQIDQRTVLPRFLNTLNGRIWARATRQNEPLPLAAIKYGSKSPAESCNFGGVNFLTRSREPVTDDNNAGKAESVANRSPIPPLEIGSEAWSHDESDNEMLRMSCKVSRKVSSYCFKR